MGVLGANAHKNAKLLKQCTMPIIYSVECSSNEYKKLEIFQTTCRSQTVLCCGTKSFKHICTIRGSRVINFHHDFNDSFMQGRTYSRQQNKKQYCEIGESKDMMLKMLIDIIQNNDGNIAMCNN